MVLKKEPATVEEDMAYLLDKIDYMLRKIETYDRALNEFNEIKKTIEECADNSRKSKVLVQDIKEIFNLHQSDIYTLTSSAFDLSNRIENQSESVNSRIDSLEDKLEKSKNYWDCSLNKLESRMSLVMQDRPTHEEIKIIQEENRDSLCSVLKVLAFVQENIILIEDKLKEFISLHENSKAYQLSLHKDICRLQTSIARNKSKETAND